MTPLTCGWLSKASYPDNLLNVSKDLPLGVNDTFKLSPSVTSFIFTFEATRPPAAYLFMLANLSAPIVSTAFLRITNSPG